MRASALEAAHTTSTAASSMGAFNMGRGPVDSSPLTTREPPLGSPTYFRPALCALSSPSRRTRCVSLPRPRGRDREGAHNKIRAEHPLPNPPPQAGEGAHRDRRTSGGAMASPPAHSRPRFRGDERMEFFPGCEELAVTDPAQMPVRQARPRSLKPPRWSAERRASRVMGRKAPRKRLACRVMCTPNGCRCTRTSLGAPPTPRFGLAKQKLQTPDADMRRGNEKIWAV